MKSVVTAVKSASYNMVFQLVFRLATFVMNALLLRYITKEMLGVVNVRLALLYYTIIFISSEAFRKSCLVRNKRNMSIEKCRKLINLIWMCEVSIFDTRGRFFWCVILIRLLDAKRGFTVTPTPSWFGRSALCRGRVPKVCVFFFP